MVVAGCEFRYFAQSAHTLIDQLFAFLVFFGIASVFFSRRALVVIGVPKRVSETVDHYIIT